MFWDRVSPLYDLFENVYNGKVYAATGVQVAAHIAPADAVLECACGTGAISAAIAPKCASLVATDFSEGMLRRAAKKCAAFSNVTFQKADITALPFGDGQFDAAVAGNVIHLLEAPEKALRELERVVRPGGKIILPTYINHSKNSSQTMSRILGKLGANFKEEFDLESYLAFLKRLGCQDVQCAVVDGRMPCAIAVVERD